ncbi:unnamed protein product [Nippostrongylus brasiliensis]|uniref:Clathrin adaptor alpha/beta/gamma-adaptin appendage Ig-like subdomain domain-containing protein n=1 Tax=Nippostrongylus brasiliensis TaxID=27835 RepID=A0A3P7APZ2_NIPBR|nr:unnamed protein product [Nippostrongylus brasiliensis]
MSADPAAAKQVVLAEKPLISEETDLLEPSLLDQLVCHIGSLASVYHKPPSSFVDSARQPLRAGTGCTNGQSSIDVNSGAVPGVVRNAAPTVIPSQDTLIADLLSLDMSTPMGAQMGTMSTYPPMSTSGGLDDLLGLGGPAAPEPALAAPVAPPVASFDPLASLGLGGIPSAPAAAPVVPPTVAPASLSGLGDIFSGSLNLTEATSGYQVPKQLWLEAARAKGLQIEGTFVRRGGVINMEMTLTNKAMQALSGFAIQFNRNSFGLAPAEPLRVPSPLMPAQSVNVTLRCDTTGGVQKMDPLTNLQFLCIQNHEKPYITTSNVF